MSFGSRAVFSIPIARSSPANAGHRQPISHEAQAVARPRSRGRSPGADTLAGQVRPRGQMSLGTRRGHCSYSRHSTSAGSRLQRRLGRLVIGREEGLFVYFPRRSALELAPQLRAFIDASLSMTDRANAIPFRESHFGQRWLASVGMAVIIACKSHARRWRTRNQPIALMPPAKSRRFDGFDCHRRFTG